MNRAEKRDRIRTLTKRMAMFDRSRLLHESKLPDLGDEAKELLKKGEYPDKEVQRIYNTTNSLIQEVAECKLQLEFLKQKIVSTTDPNYSA